MDAIRIAYAEPARAWPVLVCFTRRIEAELRDRMRREFGWSLPRFEAMSALSRAETDLQGEGLRMSDLAAALVVSNGNVTALVDALVAEGLAIRAPDHDDRRVSIVRLTPRGRKALAAVAAAHARWLEEIFATVDPAELERLGALAAETGAEAAADRPAERA